MFNQKPTEKIAIVDFDGTLCKFAFPDVGSVEPNVKEGLQALKNAGYIIKIHSCRTATYWNRPDERIKHIMLIEQFMEKNDLPYDELILNMDKPIADVYIDDRAIGYHRNWEQIAERYDGQA
jgi:predicted phosphatase